MNRREAIIMMGSAFATFVLPVPRKRIDLLSFCAEDEGHRFDMRLPYELEDWTYATDARVCVRVRPATEDVAKRKDRMPPFDSLSWNHDKLRIPWHPLRILDPILADDSDCPACKGYGHIPAVPGLECDYCDGLDPAFRRESCPRCKGKGILTPANCVECPNCHGNAIGVFPQIVDVDGRYFDSRLYAKVQALEGEYLHDNWNAMRDYPMLKFRFDGGHGILMGLDPGSAKRRIIGGRGSVSLGVG